MFVELLDDLRADAGELSQIVRRAAGGRQKFKVIDRGLELWRRSFGLDCLRQRFGDRRLGFAEIRPLRALATRNAVDRRASDEVAIELDGAARVVVGRDRKGDAVRIA